MPSRLWIEGHLVESPVHTFVAVDHACDDPVREGSRASRAVGGDQEVVLDAQAASALPVASWFNCKNHALLDLATAGLVRVRRLVGARTDTVADRVRRLTGEPDLVDPGADAPVELGAGSRPGTQNATASS